MENALKQLAYGEMQNAIRTEISWWNDTVLFLDMLFT